MLNLVNGQHRLDRKGPRGIRYPVIRASVTTRVANEADA